MPKSEVYLGRWHRRIMGLPCPLLFHEDGGSQWLRRREGVGKEETLQRRHMEEAERKLLSFFHLLFSSFGSLVSAAESVVRGSS